MSTDRMTDIDVARWLDDLGISPWHVRAGSTRLLRPLRVVTWRQIVTGPDGLIRLSRTRANTIATRRRAKIVTRTQAQAFPR